MWCSSIQIQNCSHVEINELADNQARQGCRREDITLLSLSYFKKNPPNLSSTDGGKTMKREPNTQPSGEQATRPPTPSLQTTQKWQRSLWTPYTAAHNAQLQHIIPLLQLTQPKPGLWSWRCHSPQPRSSQRTHPLLMPPLCQGTQRCPHPSIKTPWNHDSTRVWKRSTSHGQIPQNIQSPYKWWQTGPQHISTNATY